MSIIYEALKKAEKNISLATEIKKNKEAKPATSKPSPYLVLIFVACLALYIANNIFNFFTRPKKNLTVVEPPQETASVPLPPPALASAEIKKEELTPASVPAPAPELVLNGIFYSHDVGYALINNRIVKVGDMVAGATVKKINLNDVELENEGKIIKLTSP